ncbi:hypothetical protein BJV82DRAFT_652220 [Fennellomyces sp. T-0311]|nr:hypothetical protein BJV82DRAFT_652220 [Fennellomyces sp. T-0311]
MFASAFIGRCKQCKKNGRLKNESASYAWSAARFCQNLWIEGLADQNGSRGITTAVHYKNRHALITRWHVSRCQGQRLSKSGTRLERFTRQQPWLLPLNQHKKYSTRVINAGKIPSRKRSTNMATDRELILSAALEQSSASTAQSLISIMFQALRREVHNPELAWECYNDLIVRGMLHYLTRDDFRELIRLFRKNSGHTQGLEYILALVDDMYSLGYRIGRKEKMLIMRLLGLNGKLTEMEQVFLDLKEEGMLPVDDDAQKPFNIMLDQYYMQKDTVGVATAAEKSLEIYGQMIELGVQPGTAATRFLMDSIRSVGASDNIVETVWSWFWNKIGMNVGGKTADLEPLLYREMVLYFASAGRAEYALEVNDLMVKRKIKRDVRVATALIHKVGRSGNIERAMEIFDEMTTVDGIEPTLVTFNALIDIHAHKSPEPDIEGASRMYEMLQEYGLKPDIVTMGPLIDMFAKKGDVRMVRRLSRELIDGQHLKPNQHIYSSLIECFVKHEDKQSVMDILTLMRNSKDSAKTANQATYNLIIRSFARDNDLKGALDLLHLMIKAKISPNPRTFVPLLGHIADQGNVALADRVVNLMGKIGTRMNVWTYTALLEAYTHAGDIRGAERIFQKMKKKCLPNTQAFNVLMYGYIKKNEMDMVLDTYRQMLKSFVRMNEYTYGILMYYFSRRKEPKAVESLLETMKNNAIEPQVTNWTILMQSYFDAERFEDGLQVYDRMKLAGVKPNYVTYSLIVATCVRTGDLSLAESIVTNAIDRYEQHQNKHANRLADAHITSTEAYSRNLPLTVDEILKRREEQQPPAAKLPPHLFDPMINAYISRSEFTKAKQMFRQMIDLDVAVSTPVYVSMMKLYRHEERSDIVERMWDYLYTRQEDIVPMADMDPELGSSVPLPVAIKDYSSLLLEGENATYEAPQKQLNVASPFALSIYIDTLVQEQRFDDLEKLWDQLTAEGYPFDEHNWNRYLASLAESGRIDQVSTMAQKFLSDEQNVDRQERRLDVPTDQDRQLYNSTCRTLADALDIASDGLTERQLYDAVLGALKINSI